jgi:DNA-binding NtrC family response regulator
LAEATFASLHNYDSSGNVRELRNVIERVVILARSGWLHFDLRVKGSAPAPASSRPGSGDKPGPEFFAEAEMQRRERDKLLVLLGRNGWKIKSPDRAPEL